MSQPGGQSNLSVYTCCTMCGSPKLISADTVHELVECTDCGLIFAARHYSTLELANLYKSLYNRGGAYDHYYLSALQLLRSGKTPWIGFERRKILTHLIQQGVAAVGEIGAGYGMTAQWLKRFGVEYHGFEFDETTAQTAQGFGFNICLGDHSRLKAMCRELDALVAFEVLEHVPDIRECFDDIRTCLKPSGLLGITVPNYNCRLNDPGPTFLGQDKPPIHLNFWTLQSLKRTLELCGFAPEMICVRRRPNLNIKNPVGTLTNYFKALIKKYHGKQILCVARKR
jgi:SAM-dependent methyltransferase